MRYTALHVWVLNSIFLGLAAGAVYNWHLGLIGLFTSIAVNAWFVFIATGERGRVKPFRSLKYKLEVLGLGAFWGPIFIFSIWPTLDAYLIPFTVLAGLLIIGAISLMTSGFVPADAA